MKPPSGPKKQSQNKPNFRKAKMNLKSLAKKSAHTLLCIYLNLFLTPPKQTAKVPPSNFEPRPSFHSEGRGEPALYH